MNEHGWDHHDDPGAEHGLEHGLEHDDNALHPADTAPDDAFAAPDFADEPGWAEHDEPDWAEHDEPGWAEHDEPLPPEQHDAGLPYEHHEPAPHAEFAEPQPAEVVGADPDAVPEPDLPADPAEAFPPMVDVGPLPEPVDGFPWIDTGSLGLVDAGLVDADAGHTAPDPQELAAYAAEDLPPGQDPWAALAGSDDPATSALARFYAPGSPSDPA